MPCLGFWNHRNAAPLCLELGSSGLWHIIPKKSRFKSGISGSRSRRLRPAEALGNPVPGLAKYCRMGGSSRCAAARMRVKRQNRSHTKRVMWRLKSFEREPIGVNMPQMPHGKEQKTVLGAPSFIRCGTPKLRSGGTSCKITCENARSLPLGELLLMWL